MPETDSPARVPKNGCDGCQRTQGLLGASGESVGRSVRCACGAVQTGQRRTRGRGCAALACESLPTDVQPSDLWSTHRACTARRAASSALCGQYDRRQPVRALGCGFAFGGFGTAEAAPLRPSGLAGAVATSNISPAPSQSLDVMISVCTCHGSIHSLSIPRHSPINGCAAIFAALRAFTLGRHATAA